ncbi:MAG: hypothetical protein F3741_02260 [Nitrospinae bacterium]|nr:hypothetical protein [Nitrospinota bacterium]
MKKLYSSKMDLEGWLCFFKQYIVFDDLGEEVTESFLKHLADLNVLRHIDSDIWQWGDAVIDSESLISTVQSDLEELSKTESGFALAYFIAYKAFDKKPLFTESMDANITQQKGDDHTSQGRPASNLSNLQIVKKVGRQLQPFMEIEESVIKRLVGNHTEKPDAKRLFHYMFGKVGSKAGPRTWEQISRKRHR